MDKEKIIAGIKEYGDKELIISYLCSAVIIPILGDEWDDSIIDDIIKTCNHELESVLELSPERIIKLGLNREFLLCYIKVSFVFKNVMAAAKDFISCLDTEPYRIYVVPRTKTNGISINMNIINIDEMKEMEPLFKHYPYDTPVPVAPSPEKKEE